MIRTTAATIKYISELRKSPVSVRGKDAKHIILITFSPTPDIPFPAITAFIYFPGNMPARPNTLVYPTALVIPINTAITHIIANPTSMGKVALNIGVRTSKIANAI